MESEGWEVKLDADKLRKEAEGKEAKLKRQQEQRLIRAELRREKRAVKSEAKQARKLNVTRAAKWTPERKALDKQKKLATRPHKQEKRRRRMRQRAEKLEAQARKLWAEAQKARARADVLDEMREKEDEVKNRLKNEIEQMAQDPENDDYIPLDVPPTINGDSTNPQAEKKKMRQDTKLQDKTLDQIMAEELGPSITENGRHIEAELEKKRKRKEEKRAEKRKREAEENEAQESSADVMDVDTKADAEDEIETPKDKKKKKRKVEPTSDNEEAETPKAKKDKKKKKDKKAHTTEENGTSEVGDANEVPKEEKDKKKKKEKEQESNKPYVSTSTTEAVDNTDGGEQWNVSALDGDDKRKQKFLRLLGAKKSNGVSSDGHTTSTPSKADIAKMQSDLERQFDVGMKMKEAGQSRRKGLGA
ncbi:hypothetical protein HD806DRAFT_497867 [Xylariaceae sp. AK1471]|nr:hypothetical protein HD806DRAFT_497867 [Xylariaceae sp. AK1471]